MLNSPQRIPTPIKSVGLRHKDLRSEALNVEPTVQGSNKTLWPDHCAYSGASYWPVPMDVRGVGGAGAGSAQTVVEYTREQRPMWW